jgi:predicted DNA-binding transcriptional regulator AlpA
MTNDSKLLRPAAVAARLGISRKTVYRWAAQGRLPPPTRLSAAVIGWPADVVERVLRGDSASAAARA